jgi:hypothetical protein
MNPPFAYFSGNLLRSLQEEDSSILTVNFRSMIMAFVGLHFLFGIGIFFH